MASPELFEIKAFRHSSRMEEREREAENLGGVIMQLMQAMAQNDQDRMEECRRTVNDSSAFPALSFLLYTRAADLNTKFEVIVLLNRYIESHSYGTMISAGFSPEPFLEEINGLLRGPIQEYRQNDYIMRVIGALVVLLAKIALVAKTLFDTTAMFPDPFLHLFLHEVLTNMEKPFAMCNIECEEYMQLNRLLAERCMGFLLRSDVCPGEWITIFEDVLNSNIKCILANNEVIGKLSFLVAETVAGSVEAVCDLASGIFSFDDLPGWFVANVMSVTCAAIQIYHEHDICDAFELVNRVVGDLANKGPERIDGLKNYDYCKGVVDCYITTAERYISVYPEGGNQVLDRMNEVFDNLIADDLIPACIYRLVQIHSHIAGNSLVLINGNIRTMKRLNPDCLYAAMRTMPFPVLTRVVCVAFDDYDLQLPEQEMIRACIGSIINPEVGPEYVPIEALNLLAKYALDWLRDPGCQGRLVALLNHMAERPGSPSGKYYMLRFLSIIVEEVDWVISTEWFGKIINTISQTNEANTKDFAAECSLIRTCALVLKARGEAETSDGILTKLIHKMHNWYIGMVEIIRGIDEDEHILKETEDTFSTVIKDLKVPLRNNRAVYIEGQFYDNLHTALINQETLGNEDKGVRSIAYKITTVLLKENVLLDSYYDFIAAAIAFGLKNCPCRTNMELLVLFLDKFQRPVDAIVLGTLAQAWNVNDDEEVTQSILKAIYLIFEKTADQTNEVFLVMTIFVARCMVSYQPAVRECALTCMQPDNPNSQYIKNPMWRVILCHGLFVAILAGTEVYQCKVEYVRILAAAIAEFGGDLYAMLVSACERIKEEKAALEFPAGLTLDLVTNATEETPYEVIEQKLAQINILVMEAQAGRLIEHDVMKAALAVFEKR